MKNKILTFLILSLGILTSCNPNAKSQISDEAVWRLGWRMIVNSMEENYELANLQFDSLLSISTKIDRKYLITSLEVKNQLGENDEIAEILKVQDKDMLQEVCTRQFLKNMKPCLKFSHEKVENENLQIELIRMYVNDQAVRGNLMNDIILKYNLDTAETTQSGGTDVDEKNRSRLKEIFKEYGFPTKKLVGKDAMYGIFLMIQHSDMDKQWQKSQLENIKKAVKNGDMDGQSYAYLYDRIKINNGGKQLYGTQFSKVNPINKTVELAPTEGTDSLDKRRMEIGMMPIDMYKEFMLKNL